MKNISISVISKACGIQAHTLRVWEQRYNAFAPERDKNGRRLYDEDDLERARYLSKLTSLGHTISEIATLPIVKLNSLLDVHSDNSKTDNEKNQKTKSLIKYLADYDIDQVSKELQHIRLSTGAKEFVLDVVLPTMREIGVLCSKGIFSVTQEHILSTLIRDQLSQIYLPNLGDKSTQMALATPEGNLHELSIIIADILCRSHRYTTRYLGAAHPAVCLSEAINALKTPILILGVLSSDQWDYSKKMIPYLEEIDKDLKNPLKIILGGGYKLDFPKFKNIKQIIIFSSFNEFDDYLEALL